MGQGPDYEHWTLKDLKRFADRIDSLQAELSVAAFRCTDPRIRVRANVAELMLRAVGNILEHEPDDEGAKRYTLGKLNNGIGQYGMRAELVPNSRPVKSYVLRRDGRPRQ